MILFERTLQIKLPVKKKIKMPNGCSKKQAVKLPITIMLFAKYVATFLATATIWIFYNFLRVRNGAVKTALQLIGAPTAYNFLWLT